jgi:hypothetical protein
MNSRTDGLLVAPAARPGAYVRGGALRNAGDVEMCFLFGARGALPGPTEVEDGHI